MGGEALVTGSVGKDPGWVARPAEVADAEPIGTLHVRSWQSAYRGVVPDEVLDALDPRERAKRWREILLDPGDNAVFVAARRNHADGRAGGELGAFCSVGPVRNKARDACPGVRTGELYALYAEPAVFGQGAGAVAHAAGIAHLVAAGFRHAVLWVLARNPRARAFYARHGWQCDNVTDQYRHESAEMTVVRYSRRLGGA